MIFLLRILEKNGLRIKNAIAETARKTIIWTHRGQPGINEIPRQTNAPAANQIDSNASETASTIKATKNSPSHTSGIHSILILLSLRQQDRDLF